MVHLVNLLSHSTTEIKDKIYELKLRRLLKNSIRILVAIYY